MQNMTFDELMIIAKMTALACGDRNVTIGEIEKDMMYSLLKRIADQRLDLTAQQKAQFKALVDVCKDCR